MRHRLLKPLRIAVTAVSLLVCVALSVLWVRSYFYVDYVYGGITNSVNLEFGSGRGSGIIVLEPVVVRPVELTHFQWEDPDIKPLWNFNWDKAKSIVMISGPYWFYLTIFTTIAALPWIKWRFSLRTLLIVVTLFAFFFGAIAISMSS